MSHPLFNYQCKLCLLGSDCDNIFLTAIKRSIENEIEPAIAAMHGPHSLVQIGLIFGHSKELTGLSDIDSIFKLKK